MNKTTSQTPQGDIFTIRKGHLLWHAFNGVGCIGIPVKSGRENELLKSLEKGTPYAEWKEMLAT